LKVRRTPDVIGFVLRIQKKLLRNQEGVKQLASKG
jgi:hypothetical protein